MEARIEEGEPPHQELLHPPTPLSLPSFEYESEDEHKPTYKIQSISIDEMMGVANPLIVSLCKGETKTPRHRLFEAGGFEKKSLNQQVGFGPYRDDQINATHAHIEQQFTEDSLIES